MTRAHNFEFTQDDGSGVCCASGDGCDVKCKYSSDQSGGFSAGYGPLPSSPRSSYEIGLNSTQLNARRADSLDVVGETW